MKIKTSELKGMALCYAVCMIEMPHLVWGETIGEHHASRQIVVPELAEPKCYSPFMNWEMFGPIIEKEGIDLASPSPIDPEWSAMQWRFRQGAKGPTPLVAAMRCFVQATLGDEIEVPDELCDA